MSSTMFDLYDELRRSGMSEARAATQVANQYGYTNPEGIADFATKLTGPRNAATGPVVRHGSLGTEKLGGVCSTIQRQQRGAEQTPTDSSDLGAR
jgi:hypothetical protein